MAERPVRILLADDQGEVRAALRLLLEQQPRLSVVGEAAGLEELFNQVTGSHPDLLLLDWELSRRMAPGSLLSTLRALDPALKVVALSGRVEARLQALGAGVDAFISKAEPPERLLGALQSIQPPARPLPFRYHRRK